MERIKNKIILILFGMLTILGVQTNDVQKTYEDEENENEHMFI